MSDRFVLVPASYVYLLREGDAGTEVLLQLRQGTPYMDGHWAAAAAGHVERGETAYDAARREALESFVGQLFGLQQGYVTPFVYAGLRDAGSFRGCNGLVRS